MDEHKLRRQEARGARAQELLKNELLVTAFESLESELSEAWRKTTPNESQRREDAWRSLKLLEKLKSGLERHVTTGKTAGKQLTEIKNPSRVRQIIDRV